MKRMTGFFVVALLVCFTTAMAACGGSQDGEQKQVWPEPAPGCAYYMQENELPQTESAQQLFRYL